MIYSILNFLFGWDNIIWKNSADSGIARIRKDGNGRVWYWRYWAIKYADRVFKADAVIWLTCEPSKYLGDDDKAGVK